MTPKAKLLNTMENLKKFLLNAGSKKVPLIVKSSDDIINAVTNTPKENVVPIFCVSCVSGSGLPEVKRFLHLLPPGIGVKIREKLEQANPEFQIDEIFDVPNVGCVVSFFHSQMSNPLDRQMVFCYQNCSDLLWEKIALVIEKNFWNLRLKAENLQNFWNH